MGLNELAGLGSRKPIRPASSTPVTIFSTAETTGPVDWSGNGDFIETTVAADLNAVDHSCGTVFTRLSFKHGREGHKSQLIQDVRHRPT